MAIDHHHGVRQVTVGELLAEDLRIPPYQRPYSWEPSTALQLLDDISDAFRSGRAEQGDAREDMPMSYVLGAVILHRDPQSGCLDVVDGQQRLLTLLMIKKLLVGGPDGTPAADEDPRAAVVQVRQALAQRMSALDYEPAGLVGFLTTHCQFIRVETDDPDEAFRVFDSQNYRGKALRPHDLLKAYHLREMRGETLAMQQAVVDGWEQVPDAELDRLFSTYLWRILRWSRGLAAPAFSPRHVEFFKGIPPRWVRTPTARYHLAAHAAVPMMSAWSDVRSAGEVRDAGRSRFQLDAPILPGRSFFELVTFMLAELKRLRTEAFVDDGWADFASSDIELNELSSKSRYRYVCELYLAALLYYTNRFGDAELRETRQHLFRWSYALRTQLLRVQLVTVDNHARAVGERPSAFALIRTADSPYGLRELPVGALGRPQQPDHEEELVALLSELGR